MDGADIGTGEEGNLALDMGVFGVFGDEGGIDSGTHFIGGGIGEGDDEEAIDFLAVEDFLDDAFDKNRRFACTGGGGDYE